jgi:hypothetical protein
MFASLREHEVNDERLHMHVYSTRVAVPVSQAGIAPQISLDVSRSRGSHHWESDKKVKKG